MPPRSQTELSRQLRGLRPFVRKLMKEWKVPGAAIAIVKDQEVIFARGFGFRDLKRKLPVTPKTLFAIGSCTKAITATAVGMLADEKKLEWDKLVRDYLPGFQMHDPVATERMTPRDLLTHRSGLPRHDLLWYGSPFTRQQIFERLQYLEPSKDLRYEFQYQNLMYMTAGCLVEAITGGRWEEFVRQRILKPLGMDASNFSVTDSQQAADFALPYARRDGRVQEIPFRNLDAIGPAGSINSNITEMVKWLLVNLNHGRHGRKRIVSEQQLAHIHSPVVVVPGPIHYDELLPATYALGWGVQGYRGYNVISHGGGIDGFRALVSFMPQQGIGMVILMNMGTPLPEIIQFNLYDRLLGLDQIDWSRRMKAEVSKMRRQAVKARSKLAGERIRGTKPSHPLEAYAADYAHPGYGTIKVGLKRGRLHASFNAFDCALKHYHYDVFQATHELFQGMRISFLTNQKGEISSLSAPLQEGVKDIVFGRVRKEETARKP